MEASPQARPDAAEYPAFYAGYIGRVHETDILTALDAQIAEIRTQFGAIPESRGGHRYAPGKWSIKELVGHLCDGERIFAYRALRFARADSTPLPGYEEDDYVRNANFDAVPLADLVQELELLRHANVSMFRGLEPVAWSRSGLANGNPISVRAIAYTMVGHLRHHQETLRTRYLP